MSRNNVLGWTSRSAVVVVALLSAASAQESLTPTDAKPEAVELDSTVEVELSEEEMVQEVPGLLAKVRGADARVTGMLGAAKSAGDVSKVLCLDPLAGEIRIAKGAANDRGAEFNDALKRNDSVRARFAFDLLTVVKDRVEVVVGQANSCIGQETGFTGDSEVEVEVDPSLPDTNPEQASQVPTVVTSEPNVDSAAE